MSAHIIVRPLVTEKSVRLAQAENKYTFVVARGANKNQIKETLKSVYAVDAQAVNTIRGHREPKSTGKRRTRVVMAAEKKAIVKLPKGQTIDVFDVGSIQA
jgi:large subunit ribosomal protein L23